MFLQHSFPCLLQCNVYYFAVAHYTVNGALVHDQNDSNTLLYVMNRTWLHLFMILNTKLLGWSLENTHTNSNTFMWEMRVEILPCRHKEDQSLCIPQAQRTDSKPSFVSVFAGCPMNIWGHCGVGQGSRQQISVPSSSCSLAGDEHWEAR